MKALEYLKPPEEAGLPSECLEEAKDKYFTYLAAECGEIQLEGMPADQDIGSRRLRLENIFVPLHLEEMQQPGHDLSTAVADQTREFREIIRRPVGEVLNQCSRIAILAAPGGGKSTLIKRLAIAYAYPDRRKAISDQLPDKQWLSLFIRCRQIGDMARKPINEILKEIPQRAEMGDLADAFLLAVNRALRDGEALLLVDGLDEISDEGARIAFVYQLRTFLTTYPRASVVVTSREAGFRIIGGALASQCVHFGISGFDNEDISRLTVAWHREVVGESKSVRIEAVELANNICDSDRVRQLAQNPLLLTTLLLVKRRVGHLPTRRSVLYGKAIEVLLMTWNVEGHDSLNQDEVIPQLAFVAFAMMSEGVQRISSKRLRQHLELAREEMPEVLAYTKMPVSELIERVELRISLLMLSGHEVEDGTLYPFYEFRHLTFQEYLAGLAIVEGHYPNHNEMDTIVSVLETHIDDEIWKEVFPLVAVLAGRRVQPLIRRLIEMCQDLPPRMIENSAACAQLLVQCILDEVQIPPETLREALVWVSRKVSETYVRPLLAGRHGNDLVDVVNELLLTVNFDFISFGRWFFNVNSDLHSLEKLSDLDEKSYDTVADLLTHPGTVERGLGAMAAMEIAFAAGGKIDFPNEEGSLALTAEDSDRLAQIGDLLMPVLHSEVPHLQFASSWALAWLGHRDLWNPRAHPETIPRLLEIWRTSDAPELIYMATWALANLPIIDRHSDMFAEPQPGLSEFLRTEFLVGEDASSGSIMLERYKRSASLTIGFYARQPWTDEELAGMVTATGVEFEDRRQSLLNQLSLPTSQ